MKKKMELKMYFLLAIGMMLLTSCVTTKISPPEPTVGDSTIVTPEHTFLPDTILGRDPEALLPCANSIALVAQILAIPSIEITTSPNPSHAFRTRAEAINASYSYSLKAVNPSTCSEFGPAFGGSLITFGFSYFQDRSAQAQHCVEASFVNLSQFDAPVHNELIKVHFHMALWEQMDMLQTPFTDGGQCEGIWSEMPPPYWP
ncbi:MAG: hypothetical protein HKN85_09260 [Gammaproteobacteria bacterium]|nr:hypothetical protein [Gammaproteobacteria bacterium]